jgi:hypothetical protein
MKRSDINPMPQYYDHYINLVADIDLLDAFDASIRQLDRLNRDFLTRLGDKAYAPDKWTAKEIIQHVTDWERILAYRTLLFARREATKPESIDPILLAKNSHANNRSIDNLIDELKIVRLGTRSMFNSFDNEAMLRKGVSWDYEVSVLAMGFMILGHQTHHLKVIEDKYYRLIEAS